MAAEANQEIGRVGAQRVKRLLEATLRFNVPYNAYKHEARVELDMLTGHVERYDLNGDVLGEDGEETTRIYIESKNLEGAGSQSAEFKRFLAQAYSATKHRVGPENKGSDPNWHFMWATTCPWIGDGFRKVASEESLRAAIDWDKTRDLTVKIANKVVPRVIPEDHVLHEATVRLVADRIWVWVISDRQEHMVLGPKMRGWVQDRLAQEAP